MEFKEHMEYKHVGCTPLFLCITTDSPSEGPIPYTQLITKMSIS